MPYSCQPKKAAIVPPRKLSAAPPLTSASFTQFLLSGAVCFVLGTALLYFLTDVCKIHYLLSTLLGSLLTNGLGFWLNRRFAFREHARHFWRELIRYYIVNMGSLALNIALMGVCVSLLGIPYLLASMGLSVLLTATNFLLHRFWSFGTR